MESLRLQGLKEKYKMLLKEKEELVQKLAELKCKVAEFDQLASPLFSSHCSRRGSGENLEGKERELYSVQRSKLLVFQKLREVKFANAILSCWKKETELTKEEESKKESLLRRSQGFEIRSQREEEEESILRSNSLEKLRERLERSPRPRRPCVAKIGRQKQELRADTFYERVKSRNLRRIFEEWKESNQDYRDSSFLKKESEQRRTLGACFGVIKSFTIRLQKSATIIKDRKQIKALKIKRTFFGRLKDEWAEAKESSELQTRHNKATLYLFMQKWKESYQSSKKVEDRVKFLRIKLLRTKKEHFFEMFRDGVRDTKTKKQATILLLNIRDRLVAKKRFHKFMRALGIHHKLSNILAESNKEFKSSVWNSFCEVVKREISHKKGFGKIAKVEQNIKQSFRSAFFELFSRLALRKINKEKVMQFLTISQLKNSSSEDN